MAKITKKEIVVTQATKENPNGINPVSVVVGSKRLLDTSDTSVSNKLAAMILTEAVIKELKDHLENLSEQLEGTSYDDITKALIDEGVLAPGETPVISVVDKKGNKISKVLTSTTKNDLVYDTFKALAIPVLVAPLSLIQETTKPFLFRVGYSRSTSFLP